MTGPVIAISGPPGAGKSTIGLWLAQTFVATRIDYDDYEMITQKLPSEIADWMARGSPINEISAPGMVEAVSLARANGAVIFETPLGREWSGTAGLIDLLIWVETPLDLALSRKLSGMAKTAANSAGGDSHFAAWMSGFLDAYESVIRPSLLLQKERIKASADIAILNDGSLDTAQNALLPDLLSKFILVARP